MKEFVIPAQPQELVGGDKKYYTIDKVTPIDQLSENALNRFVEGKKKIWLFIFFFFNFGFIFF